MSSVTTVSGGVAVMARWDGGVTTVIVRDDWEWGGLVDGWTLDVGFGL